MGFTLLVLFVILFDCFLDFACLDCLVWVYLLLMVIVARWVCCLWFMCCAGFVLFVWVCWVLVCFVLCAWCMCACDLDSGG